MRKPKTKEKSKLMSLVVSGSPVDAKLKERAKSYLQSIEKLKEDVDDLIDEGGLSIREAKEAMEFLQDSFIASSALGKLANGETEDEEDED